MKDTTKSDGTHRLSLIHAVRSEHAAPRRDATSCSVTPSNALRPPRVRQGSSQECTDTPPFSPGHTPCVKTSFGFDARLSYNPAPTQLLHGLLRELGSRRGSWGRGWG